MPEHIAVLPRWLRFQRAGLLLYGGLGVLLLVYALGFMTGVYIFFAYGNQSLVAFYRAMQGINAVLLRNALVVIVCALVLFILELWQYAPGIITLLTSAGISAAGLFFSAGSVLTLYGARLEYAALDLSPLDRYIERGTIAYTPSTASYSLGMGLYVLFFCASLFLLVTVLVNALTGRGRLPPEACPNETV